MNEAALKYLILNIERRGNSTCRHINTVNQRHFKLYGKYLPLCVRGNVCIAKVMFE